jgi:hypothetical protein
MSVVSVVSEVTLLGEDRRHPVGFCDARKISVKRIHLGAEWVWSAVYV